MCLVKQSKLPKRAKKDIVVYKFVEVINDDIKLFKTPYQDNYVYLGDKYKSSEHPFRAIFGKTIYGEGIHSFILERTAVRRAMDSTIGCGLKRRFAAIKCHIPKGSYYYLGTNMDIASQYLCYDEKVFDT